MELKGLIGKLHNKNEGPTDKKVISFKKDRGTLWLIEVLHAIKRNALWFIGSFESYMQKIKIMIQKIGERLLSRFRNRHRDIVALDVMYTIQSKDCAKKTNKDLNQEIRKLSAFKPFQDR